LFRESVCAVDPCSAGASEDSETDENVSYCELSSDVVDDLMGRCNRHFSRAELTALRRFIDGHRKGCDVMTLVKRRVVTIEQHAP